MAFTEAIKQEIRRKTAFQCCRCRSFGVEIHHIIPQESGGLDTIDNVAPLCPNCHTDFGANPEKRKVIKEMRDWWFEAVEKMFAGQGSSMEFLQKIDSKITEMKASQSGDMSEIKDLLKQYTDKAIEKMTPQNIQMGVAEIVTATVLGDGVYANFHCRNCGTYIGLLIGSNKCPQCGTTIKR